MIVRLAIRHVDLRAPCDRQRITVKAERKGDGDVLYFLCYFARPVADEHGVETERRGDAIRMIARLPVGRTVEPARLNGKLGDAERCRANVYVARLRRGSG